MMGKHLILSSKSTKIKKSKIFFEQYRHTPIFAVPKQREFSSAGSEHLPYKQRVTGSNPVTPTLIKPLRDNLRGFLLQ
jgi:hypothetical protein